MVFNSLVFIAFALVFFALWPLAARRKNARWIFICVASFIFYGWWDWRYLPLMIATALVDFYAGLAMERFPNRKKAILMLSLGTNLGVLCGFKYWGFFARTLNQSLELAGLSVAVPVIDPILPLGISFYTFHSMSYSIDVYQGEIKPTRNIFHFMAFISMFPMLVAGPIVRGKQVLPQLETWQRPDAERIWDGIKLVASGYFKKLVIADNLAVAVNQAYSSADAGALYWWLVGALFIMQMYCDFSGYSDIARGLANWMGYQLPVNFNHPFVLARSLRQFWERWHISLTTWFRDYVYIPLDYAGRGLHPHRSLIITMALMGLWHGAAWTFVAFGVLNGVFLTVERVTRWPDRLARLPFGIAIGWVLMVAQIIVVAAIFRSGSIAEAGSILKEMFIPTSTGVESILALGAVPLSIAAMAVIAEFGVCYLKPRLKESGFYGNLEPVAVSILVMASIFLRGPGSTFIYFQF